MSPTAAIVTEGGSAPDEQSMQRDGGDTHAHDIRTTATASPVRLIDRVPIDTGARGLYARRAPSVGDAEQEFGTSRSTRRAVRGDVIMGAQSRCWMSLTHLALTYLALSFLTSTAAANGGPPPISCADQTRSPDRDTTTHALFLNATAPTSTTPKFIDSPSLSTASGNPYKVIGAWEVGLIDPPGCHLQSTASLSALHVWIGLKNSDDIGTKFDLL